MIRFRTKMEISNKIFNVRPYCEWRKTSRVLGHLYLAKFRIRTFAVPEGTFGRTRTRSSGGTAVLVRPVLDRLVRFDLQHILYGDFHMIVLFENTYPF